MKRILQLVVLAGLVLSLNSCGLPGALVRSAGNLVNTASALANGT
ncbi:MAG: hypothetical protein WEB53_07270 [Akkermansiaceae bacterium]|jgi:hypothetical protein